MVIHGLLLPLSDLLHSGIVESHKGHRRLRVARSRPGFRSCDLPRYFFDSYDDGRLLEDDVGLEYSDLEAVKAEAARALAELARDVLPGKVQRELAIEVRDEAGPVLRAVMKFEALVLRAASS
jgi:hypothetical protein